MNDRRLDRLIHRAIMNAVSHVCQQIDSEICQNDTQVDSIHLREQIFHGAVSRAQSRYIGALSRLAD